MAEIHRVLWIDDVAQNIASDLFQKDETKIVTSMDEAIEEISGSHLYDYDTIVLDIDFENGVIDASNIVEKLTSQLYLEASEKNNEFIITNGGYLLYLYLLKRGYPSDQIAFLTGNPAIVDQLKTFTMHNMKNKKMSHDDIVKCFKDLREKYPDDIDQIEREIDKLPVDQQYKDADFVYDCLELLDHGYEDRLEEKVKSIVVSNTIEELKNTGDMMIFKFHKANLEAPEYFSKRNDDIEGHNKNDAEQWLNRLRNVDQLTRWLLLSICEKIDELYKKDSNQMSIQYGKVYKKRESGVRNSFRQMYCVLDGLRSGVHREVYYQAISAMLVPYETNIKSVDKDYYNDDIRVRWLFAECSRIARNLFAHNRFGTVVSAKTSLFVTIMAVSAIISKQQRSNLNAWYKKSIDLLDSTINISSNQEENANKKVKDLLERLIANNCIDFGQKKANFYTDYTTYTSVDTLYAFTNNHSIDEANLSKSDIENYFVFALASAFVKWFEQKDLKTISFQYGKQVADVYCLTERIVYEYQYPLL